MNSIIPHAGIRPDTDRILSQYAPEHNRLKAYIDGYKLGIVKLHLGCGGIRWRDFINVDMYPAEAGTPDSSRIGCVADVFADMRKLGLANYSVDEIFTSHTIDHFPAGKPSTCFVTGIAC